MPTTSPKNSRDKRLHLVFFTDASKTKSTSISLRNLALLGGGLALFFSAAGVSLYLYNSNRNLLSQKNEYIRELKSAIAALAVTNEKTNINLANETDPQTELSRRVAREIEIPSETDSKTAVAGGANTLESLQSSLSSLSTVSASLARNDKPAQPPVNFAEKKSSANAVAATSASSSDKAMQARAPSNIPVPEQTPKTPLVGVQVEQRHTTEFNGQTTLHFQLVNTSRNRSQSWTGRVCGVVELNSAVQQQKASAAGMIAIPSGQPVQNAENPSNSCADGELVRFSRLRPTELVVPARQESIKRVTIFFVESGSNRVLTQQIEL
ncbi:MAG: hypothetical protein RI932_2194 [Pseudomonadota bacterium]